MGRLGFTAHITRAEEVALSRAEPRRLGVLIIMSHNIGTLTKKQAREQIHRDIEQVKKQLRQDAERVVEIYYKAIEASRNRIKFEGLDLSRYITTGKSQIMATSDDLDKITELASLFTEEIAGIREALEPTDILIVTPLGITLLSDGVPNPEAAGVDGPMWVLATRNWSKRQERIGIPLLALKGNTGDGKHA